MLKTVLTNNQFYGFPYNKVGIYSHTFFENKV